MQDLTVALQRPSYLSHIISHNCVVNMRPWQKLSVTTQTCVPLLTGRQTPSQQPGWQVTRIALSAEWVRPSSSTCTLLSITAVSSTPWSPVTGARSHPPAQPKPTASDSDWMAYNNPSYLQQDWQWSQTDSSKWDRGSWIPYFGGQERCIWQGIWWHWSWRDREGMMDCVGWHCDAVSHPWCPSLEDSDATMVSLVSVIMAHNCLCSSNQFLWWWICT